MTVDIESLYRSYGPMVLRRCRRLLRDEQKALDAMHDVFVELLRRKERLEDRGLSSLLLQTATNVSLNRLRTERRRPEDRDEELLFSIASAPEAEPENQALARRLLDRLLHGTAASTRLIAVLHYVDGLSLDEVATEVGMSVSGVRKRLRTLKSNLPLVSDSAATATEPYHD
jgi:RNA polymerase sigma-70 factor, ECF subfamily